MSYWREKIMVNSPPVNFSGILTSDALPQYSTIYFSESSNHPPCVCFRLYSGRQWERQVEILFLTWNWSSMYLYLCAVWMYYVQNLNLISSIITLRGKNTLCTNYVCCYTNRHRGHWKKVIWGSSFFWAKRFKGWHPTLLSWGGFPFPSWVERSSSLLSMGNR